METKYGGDFEHTVPKGRVSMATPAAEGSDTRANVLAIESARQAAVDRTRRPRWLVAAYSLTLGAAFGMATLRTPTAWAVAGILFVSGVVGFLALHKREWTRGLNPPASSRHLAM